MPYTQTRKAAHPHHCQCGKLIKRGEIHLLHTTFKSDDLPSPPDKPVQTRECAHCATRYGRATLIETRRRQEKTRAQARYLRRKQAA